MKSYQARGYISGLQIFNMNKRRAKKAMKFVKQNYWHVMNSDAWVRPDLIQH